MVSHENGSVVDEYIEVAIFFFEPGRKRLPVPFACHVVLSINHALWWGAIDCSNIGANNNTALGGEFFYRGLPDTTSGPGD